MYYITLDTNTWIYLANGTEPVKILHFIKKELDKNNIKILLPRTIIQEWNVHKEKTVKIGTLNYFKEVTSSLEKLKKMIGDSAKPDPLDFLFEKDKDKDKVYFQDIIDKFKSKKGEIEKAVNENIIFIDNLFKHKNTKIIEISDFVKLKSGQFAFEKKAPFGKKNSFADALIVFSFLEYVKENEIEEASFITYNIDDFCEKKEGKKYLHRDLKPDFETTKSKFYTVVGKAINSIEKGIVTQEELDYIEQQQLEIADETVEFCRECSEMNDRLNLVEFGAFISLEDNRKILQYDPNQLEFDFAKDMPKSKYKKPIDEIEIGYCNWCNTLHYKCVECDTVNAVLENNYDEIIECEGCGQEYRIEVDKTPHNYNNIQYFIIHEEKRCSICGNVLVENELEDDKCIDCQ